MRVLQTTTDADRRGAQIFAHELGPTLGEGQWNVRTVALAAGSGGPQLPFQVLGRRPLSPVTISRLRDTIKGADVVVGYGSSTLPACGIASVGTSVPFVYRSIGDLNYWANTRMKRLRVRTMLSRAEFVVALWPAAAQAIHRDFGVAEARIRVIPRGVNPAFFTPSADLGGDRRAFGLPSTAPIAAIVGSLTSEKNVDAAIRAASHFGDLHLLVAGDGPLRSELAALAHELMPGRFRFLGRVADTRPVYRASDLLLIPSLSEGVPGVVIEAGLCGRPAVATDVGGSGSVIRDGETGKLVAPQEPAALVAGIAAVLDHAAELGATARSVYEREFAITKVAQDWTSLLLSSRR